MYEQGNELLLFSRFDGKDVDQGEKLVVLRDGGHSTPD